MIYTSFIRGRKNFKGKFIYLFRLGAISSCLFNRRDVTVMVLSDGVCEWNQYIYTSNGMERMILKCLVSWKLITIFPLNGVNALIRQRTQRELYQISLNSFILYFENDCAFYRCIVHFVVNKLSKNLRPNNMFKKILFTQHFALSVYNVIL